MNKYLKQRLDGIQGQLNTHYLGGVNMASATKGNERETLIKEFLSKVFPSPYRFGSGCITDSNDIISGQVDIAIEMPYGPSFPNTAGVERLYLAESVGAVIEVKSDLSNQWDEVRNTVKQIKPLQRKITSSMSFGGYTLENDRIPIFAVGYTGCKKISTLLKLKETTPEGEMPDGVLIIDSGLYIGLNNIQAHGSIALYGLVVDLISVFNGIYAAGFELWSYVRES